MKRNENANCGNCPYWKRTVMGWWDDGLLFGWCRYWPSKIKKRDTEWCGQHPDFWEQAEITNTCPSCWPTDDAVRTPEWTHVGVQSTTYCPHCGKATTSTFEQDKS